MHTVFAKEIIISVILIALGILFLNPFMIWMPAPLLYMVSAVFVILFAVFLVFVWRERVRDEREDLHRMIAARIGYLLGMATLASVLLVQAVMTHHTDPWIIAALLIMVMGKTVGMIYSRMRY
ncbi:MAG: hypothetical protein COU47_03320 [Candidatus Niyogibacteria bacterium CG10_big_fil_rev_8_21_14_0_10_46_36]|uniref:DUF2178 domain-containing protein n=1 Tax=Candidatus Niyogibacteria bacterium CG10_big_fil_rev_8_21_14_0_10_46_36 TaxID=1974726 RepID=A0A2H0TEI7_9BACT|nr:MAG: hypothetical protein COU47_03320 [Candidatus Niyogibacteria bacterium CG10_big_fil_rev_8_21_14_0_10_46_36]